MGIQCTQNNDSEECTCKFVNLDSCTDVQQHRELGHAHALRDNCDLRKIVDYLKSHNPFDICDGRLRCVTSGVAAADSDSISCDETEEVGVRIMQAMDGMLFKDVKMRHRDCVRTLADVGNSSTVNRKAQLNVDPNILFTRLLAIVQRSSDLEQYFQYELSSEPLSLFTSGRMWKTDKSQLAKELCKGLHSNIAPQMSVHVVDGGYLLHVVSWIYSTPYSEVLQQYVRYVDKHYGDGSIIVFDGYCNGPSIKDEEHCRREAKKCAPSVVIDSSNICYPDQTSFLANERNKRDFVSLLIDRLKVAGYQVLQAIDDADTLVASVALQTAASGRVVSVIANDTDILVLLLAHFQTDMSDIFMYCKSNSDIRSIRDIASHAGSSVINRLLVLHAISGCDSTSALFWAWKGERAAKTWLQGRHS